MFTNAPGSGHSCSEHKWADKGLSQRNRRDPGVLTCLWDTASFQRTAPSPELQQEPQAWHGFARGIWQLTVGLNIKQGTASSVSTARRDFATCVCWEQPAHTGRDTSPAGTSQMGPSGWQCHLGLPPVTSKDTTLTLKSNLHKEHIHAPTHTRTTRVPPAGQPLPKLKLLLSYSVTSPFWALRVPKGHHWISSCHRNIQQDTAWQLVMSAALNHKHFELFRYNGKLWEGERKRTG